LWHHTFTIEIIGDGVITGTNSLTSLRVNEAFIVVGHAFVVEVELFGTIEVDTITFCLEHLIAFIEV